LNGSSNGKLRDLDIWTLSHRPGNEQILSCPMGVVNQWNASDLPHRPGIAFDKGGGKPSAMETVQSTKSIQY
jgi:hypothetical protein